jgi:hypothetical protein
MQVYLLQYLGFQHLGSITGGANQAVLEMLKKFIKMVKPINIWQEAKDKMILSV